VDDRRATTSHGRGNRGRLLRRSLLIHHQLINSRADLAPAPQKGTDAAGIASTERARPDVMASPSVGVRGSRVFNITRRPRHRRRERKARARRRRTMGTQARLRRATRRSWRSATRDGPGSLSGPPSLDVAPERLDRCDDSSGTAPDGERRTNGVASLRRCLPRQTGFLEPATNKDSRACRPERPPRLVIWHLDSDDSVFDLDRVQRRRQP